MPASGEKDILTKIGSWLGLSRPPFHTLGLLPFCLGTFLAWHLDRIFSLSVFVLGCTGIVMVMVSTHYVADFFRHAEEERRRHLFGNIFSRKSDTFFDLVFRRPGPLRIGVTSMAAAPLIGICMQFGLRTGPFTLLLGCLGAVPGCVYALRPTRMFDNGYGEMVIAACYGWTPIVAAFYIQTGYVSCCVQSMALPIALSIFNVILLNEFPGYLSSAAGSGMNLLRKLGKAKGSALFVLVSLLSWLAMYVSLNAGIPWKALYIYLPVMVLSAAVSLMLAGRRYENPLVLEILCGLNIAVHLGTMASYFLAFL